MSDKIMMRKSLMVYFGSLMKTRWWWCCRCLHQLLCLACLFALSLSLSPFYCSSECESLLALNLGSSHLFFLNPDQLAFDHLPSERERERDICFSSECKKRKRQGMKSFPSIGYFTFCRSGVTCPLFISCVSVASQGLRSQCFDWHLKPSFSRWRRWWCCSCCC